MQTKEKIKEIKRELNMRKRLYPTWVLQGRIKEETANERIVIFEEILKDYLQKQEKEDKQQILF